MNDIMKTIQSIGLVPVIKIEDAKKAVPLGKALAAGGIVWGAYELALGGGETSATVSLLPGGLELRGTF